MEVQGQVWNLYHSSNLIHSSDNTRFLTHWATRELLDVTNIFLAKEKILQHRNLLETLLSDIRGLKEMLQ